MSNKSFSQYETIKKKYDPSFVLSKITEGRVNFDGHMVSMGSIRYKCFARDLQCVSCGLSGEYMLLQRTKGGMGTYGNYHFNLYGTRNGKPVLFTKDHIYPKSLGGATTLDNLQTMCASCNEEKADKVN